MTIRMLAPLALLLGAAASATVVDAASASGADPLPQLVRILNDTPDARMRLDILHGVSAAVKGLREVPMPEGWDAVEARLGADPDPAVRALVQSLSLTFGSARARAALMKTARDGTADLDVRRAAVESLLTTREASLPALLMELLEVPQLRSVSIRGLAGFDDAGTPGAILAVYSQLTDSEKRDALNALASRAGFAQSLLDAISEDRIPRSALTAELIRQLRNLKNDRVNAELSRIYGTIRESTPDKQAEIEKYRRLYWAGGSQPGDASRGRVVFNKVCAQCHVLFDEGGRVGPDITGANRADLNYLLETILDPNAVIPNDYRASIVETRDGRSITGILTRQDDRSVTVATQTETLTLPRAEVESIQHSELSMMPEGLLASLADQEVRDLLYYLGRPGQVPLP